MHYSTLWSPERLKSVRWPLQGMKGFDRGVEFFFFFGKVWDGAPITLNKGASFCLRPD